MKVKCTYSEVRILKRAQLTQLGKSISNELLSLQNLDLKMLEFFGNKYIMIKRVRFLNLYLTTMRLFMKISFIVTEVYKEASLMGIYGFLILTQKSGSRKMSLSIRKSCSKLKRMAKSLMRKLMRYARVKLEMTIRLHLTRKMVCSIYLEGM
jgi:hypothetical protein